MKRICAGILAAIIALLPLVGMAEKPTLGIRELREQTPDHWQGEYQTVRNETVKVDCPIALPDVDAFPVIKVAWMPKRSAAVEEEWTEGLIHWSGWDEYICPHGIRIAFANVPGEFICSKDGFCEYMLPYYNGNEDYNWETTLIFPDTLDLSVAYPENCDVTLGEAVAYYQTLLDTFFADEGVEVRLSPTHLSSYDGITYSVKGHEPITPCGQYTLHFEQLIRNIPVLGTISHAFNEGLSNAKAEESLTYLGGGWGELNLAVPDEDFFAKMHLYEEREIVAQDVPMISFEAARAVWEKEIEAGRLRDVWRVELGYYAYSDATERDTIWLMPVWTCFGNYYTQADDEPLTENDGLTAADAYMDAAKMLVVSGQYGELLDRSDKASDRSVHPKLVTWKNTK